MQGDPRRESQLLHLMTCIPLGVPFSHPIFPSKIHLPLGYSENIFLASAGKRALSLFEDAGATFVDWMAFPVLDWPGVIA